MASLLLQCPVRIERRLEASTTEQLTIIQAILQSGRLMCRYHRQSYPPTTKPAPRMRPSSAIRKRLSLYLPLSISANHTMTSRTSRLLPSYATLKSQLALRAKRSLVFESMLRL